MMKIRKVANNSQVFFMFLSFWEYKVVIRRAAGNWRLAVKN